MNNKLYVGNLSAGITEAMLLELFSRKGKVDNITILMDRVTGRSRGFAYVTMATPDQARVAMDALHSFPLGDRYITVNEARPDNPNPAGQIGESYKMKRHL
jgi:RNA recognition motif-containing protein